MRNQPSERATLVCFKKDENEARGTEQFATWNHRAVQVSEVKGFACGHKGCQWRSWEWTPDHPIDWSVL